MIAMEIPMNIVFKVFERKRSGIYISAGASTMIYFNQKFTGDLVNEYTQEYFNTSTNSMSSETRYSKVSVDNSYSDQTIQTISVLPIFQQPIPFLTEKPQRCF